MARQHPLWKWVLFRLHINVPKRKIHRSWLKKTIHSFSSSLFFFFFFFFGALPFERPARPPNVPEYMIQQITSPGKKLCSV